MRLFFTRLKHAWAVLIGDHLNALVFAKELVMADLSALSAAVDRVAAAMAADKDALVAAQADAANLQPQIDALTAKLDALAPAPAA